MLEAPVLPLLLRMAAPNALAFLVQASVSMAELAFVAELGTVPLAALAFVFPGLMLMQTLANGAMGGAVSSAVARALGAGDQDRAQALVGHALLIAGVAGAAFALVWVLGGAAALQLLGASIDVRREAQSYAGIVFGGAALLWVTALMSSVFRGMGNMKLPARLMIAGACVQVPLAGALVLGWLGAPRLGLAGAAIAVVGVAAVNGGILLYLLQRGDSPVRMHLSSLRLQRALFADIFRVGALASLSPVFTVLTVSLLNGIISAFGVAALAGYGIVARLEFLLIPLVFGLGAAMTAMVGTNVGAGKLARAERIGWLGGFSAAAIAGAVGVVVALFPGLWLDLFTEDPATWAAGASYLRIVGPLFAFQGLGLALYFASQGAGTVFWPIVATVLRFAVGVGGAALAVEAFTLGLNAVYACVAGGMFAYGALTAGALKMGAWRRP